jgi:hypothetical protein
LKVAFARGLASTVVFTALYVVGILPLQQPAILALWPFVAVPFGLLVVILIDIAAAIVRLGGSAIADAFAGLTRFLVSLLLACGDPLVYIFNRAFPAVLEIADFKPVNLQPLLVVYNRPSLAEEKLRV